jgi:hypothetical protein
MRNLSNGAEIGKWLEIKANFAKIGERLMRNFANFAKIGGPLM